MPMRSCPRARLAGLPVVGLPGSRLQHRATGRVHFIAEGFADRALPPGRLTRPARPVRGLRRRLARGCRASAATGRRSRCADDLRTRRQPAGGRFVRAVRDELLACRGRAPAVRMSLRVLAAGTHSLIVDAGRPRSRGLGIPVGGPADRTSLALGNALVGNPPFTPALEITLSGPTLSADANVGMCVFGAPFRLDRDGDAGRARAHVHAERGPDTSHRWHADRVSRVPLRTRRVSIANGCWQCQQPSSQSRQATSWNVIHRVYPGADLPWSPTRQARAICCPRFARRALPYCAVSPARKPTGSMTRSSTTLIA